MPSERQRGRHAVELDVAYARRQVDADISADAVQRDDRAHVIDDVVVQREVADRILRDAAERLSKHAPGHHGDHGRIFLDIEGARGGIDPGRAGYPIRGGDAGAPVLVPAVRRAPPSSG